MKFTLAISFGLIFAYIAAKIDLAPIVGAFAAGLVLDPVHFKYFKNPEFVDELNKKIETAEPSFKEKISGLIERHIKRHVEDLIEPVSYFLVPIFFVVTGLAVKLEPMLILPVFFVSCIKIEIFTIIFPIPISAFFSC